MSDLVHRLLLRTRELPLLIDRLLFEEVPYLVARRQEVVVPDMIIVSRRELRLHVRESAESSVSRLMGTGTRRPTHERVVLEAEVLEELARPRQ